MTKKEEHLNFFSPAGLKAVLKRIFLTHWPRKLVALISAIIIWFLVNQSITETQTFPDVAVRVINVPPDKTVIGLLPNGLLNKKISVTLTGTKSSLEDLKSSDIEVVVNAEGKKESWLEHIDKRSISNLSSEWDLKKSITEVSGSDLFIKLSKLMTADIKVTIPPPLGDPPKGYQFLDVWPRTLNQKISGPEEEIESLKKEGLELTFNLNRITKEELEAIKGLQTSLNADEVSFYVPESWKEVAIPFRNYALEPLNDPRAKYLRLDFLKQELIPLNEKLPISVFYPLKYSHAINPETYSLQISDLIEKKNGITLLNYPLYVHDVSRLFLDVVRENLEIVLIAAPKGERKSLKWTVEFINPKALEDNFVLSSLEGEGPEVENTYRGEMLRQRFREYMQKFTLYNKDETPLKLKAKLNQNTIILEVSK